MLWVIYPTQNSYCSFPKKTIPNFLGFIMFSSCFIPHVSWFSHPTSTAFKASKAPQTRSTPLPTFRCVASRLLGPHERLGRRKMRLEDDEVTSKIPKKTNMYGKKRLLLHRSAQFIIFRRSSLNSNNFTGEIVTSSELINYFTSA